MEQSSVRFGSTEIAFAVRRSRRRRTVSIAVDTESRVVVTAPHGADLPRLDAVVRSKAPWIVERLRRRSELPATRAEREFISGESFRYLGKQYRLRLEDDAAPAPVRLRDGRLVLPVPHDLGARHHAGYVRAALCDWYLARARDVIPTRVRCWETRVGVAPERVSVTSAAKRWGSVASDGTLRINWRIVQAPLALVDYVVVHELAHLAHFDHGPAFWRLVERVQPDFLERKRRLRELGASLAW